jgi:hypothetical protein
MKTGSRAIRHDEQEPGGFMEVLIIVYRVGLG